MKKVVYKLFWAWDFEKEEKWLNEMAEKGYALSSASFARYTFDVCQPGEYTVRLELLDELPSHPKSQQYIEFLEDMNAEYIGSCIRWVYFRKKTEFGEFNLCSDITSRIKHLNRIINLLLIIAGINATIGLANTSIAFGNEVGINLPLGSLNLILAFFLMIGCLGLIKKRSKLNKEKQIFE